MFETKSILDLIFEHSSPCSMVSILNLSSCGLDLGFSLAFYAAMMGRDISFSRFFESKDQCPMGVPLSFEFIVWVSSCIELKNPKSSCTTKIISLFESIAWTFSYSELKDPKSSCSTRVPLSFEFVIRVSKW